MVAAAVLLLVGQARAQAWLHPDPDGIILEVGIQLGHGPMRPADASKAIVAVMGPDGYEPVRVTPAPSTGKYRNAVRVDVERSPSAGWRTMTVVQSGHPLPTFPPRYKESLRYYLSDKNSNSRDALGRNHWIGKQCWLFGSAVWDADKTFCWNPCDPVTILDIKRVDGAVLDNCGCPVWNVFNGWQNGSFLCGGYLDVSVLLPKGAWSLVVMGANANLASPEDRRYLSGPVNGHLFVADWWQMDRAFRTTSPAPILAKESAKVCEAFVSRQLVQGMPRSLVALLIGDPEPSAPATEVWRRKSWNWIGGPANGEYIVTFDSRDRVRGYGSTIPRLP